MSNTANILTPGSDIISDISGTGFYVGRDLTNAPPSVTSSLSPWWYLIVIEYINPNTNGIYRRYIAFDVFDTTNIYTINYESKSATEDIPFGKSSRTKIENTWIPVASWT